MSEVGRLFVSIFAKTDEFQKGLQNVQQTMGNVGRGMQQVGGAMTKYVTLPMIAAGTALFGGAVKAGQFADELLDLSAVTGVHTDELQRWRYMAVAAGTDTDAVADALSRMNRQMVEGDEFGKRLERTAESYGVALRDANGEVRAGTDVITDLMMAIAEIEDPTERARAGAQAFGRDWEAIAPIVDLGTEAIQNFAGQDVISRDKLEQMNEFRQSWDELKHGLQMAFYEIVGDYIPVLTEFVSTLKDRLEPVVENIKEKIAELVEWWQNLSPATQKFIGIALAVVAAAGPLLTILGTILVMLSMISAPILIIVAKIALIIAIIGAVVAVLKHFWDTNEEFREFIINAWETIKEHAQAIWEAITQIIETVMETIAAIKEKYGEQIAAFQEAVWNQIKNTIETIINIIAGIIKFVLALIQGDWKGAWEALKSVGEAIWNYIKNTATNLFQALAAALSVIWDLIRTTAVNVWECMKQAVIQKAQELYNNARSELEELWTYIKGIPAQAIQWGKNIIQGLIDGIRQMGSNLAGALRNVVDSAVNSVKSFLGISSPSKLFEGFGRNLGEGLAKGMEAARGLVSDASLSMAGATISAVSPGSSHVSFDLNGLFAGANISIGSERDAQTLAREIFKLADTRARSEGVML